MRALIIVACAGCGFGSPTAPDGQTGDPDGGTGGGTDSGTPGDRDGDGIADATDLCPDVADPYQRDHDLDLRGDLCDRCPAITNLADPDGDGDGVGDDCDPSPAVPGDRPVLWIGFWPEDQARISNNAQWTRVGTWQITDGWVWVDAGGLDSLRSTLMVRSAVVTSRIRLDDTSASTTAAGVISGLIGSNGSPTQFYQCVILKGQQRVNARSYFASTQTDGNRSWPSAITDGLVVDVTANFEGTSFECNYAAPSTTATVVSGANIGNVELIVQDAIVSFDYLFVVEPPL